MESAQKKSAVDLVEAVVETGLGLAAISADWVGQFVEQVSPKLSPARERGAKLLEELRGKGKAKREGAAKFASGAVEYVRERSGLARSDEIKALEEKVASLEREVARLQAGRAESAS